MKVYLSITKKMRLRKPILICAWPGMGEVAYKLGAYLKDKLKMDMEPLLKNDAKAIIEIRAKLFMAKPSVLGKEVRTADLMFEKLTAKENCGVKPHCLDAVS